MAWPDYNSHPISYITITGSIDANINAISSTDY